MTFAVTSKDETRIQDMARKAGGDRNKMMRLALQMANSITKVDKAIRRARAVEDLNYYGVAEIFFIRAAKL